ncbi:MAG TPA: endonuclease/exonuclease/phosphatase family protein [Myxococcales bacterium]|jgi:endonuclease/exonuclease/phosphatase family metal-dependent hydrolase
MKRVLLAQLATLLALSSLVGSSCLSTEHEELRRFPDAGDTGPHPPDARAPGPDAGPGLDAELPVPVPDGAVRVASLNTHLFFDTVCESGACGGSNFEQAPSPEWFESRAQQIADGIRSLQPTAMLLQEVETQACLDALSSRLSDVLPIAVLGEQGYPGSVDVAVMAQGELLEVRRHANVPLTKPDGSTTWFTREFLEVHLGLDGQRVIVFAAHFRSQNKDDPDRRLAEAQAALQIVAASAAEFPQALIVMGGDLNDDPGSAPLLALTESGELLRVAQDLPPVEQLTYLGYGGHAFDHLFLDTRARGSCLPGGVKVVCKYGGFAGSDHCAIRADFGF